MPLRETLPGLGETLRWLEECGLHFGTPQAGVLVGVIGTLVVLAVVESLIDATKARKSEVGCQGRERWRAAEKVNQRHRRL